MRVPNTFWTLALTVSQHEVDPYRRMPQTIEDKDRKQPEPLLSTIAQGLETVLPGERQVAVCRCHTWFGVDPAVLRNGWPIDENDAAGACFERNHIVRSRD